MATATKKKTEPVKATKAVKGQPRLNSDGTPYTPPPRRPNDVILAEYKVKREAVLARHAKELAKVDAKIAFFEKRGATDPKEAEEAAKELLAAGYSLEDIAALAAKAKKAQKLLAGKSPEEIAAFTAPVPAFLAPPADEDDEDGEGDEE